MNNTQREPRRAKNIRTPVKTRTHSNKKNAQTAREEEEEEEEEEKSPAGGPATGGMSLTHAHSFASPARTNKSKSTSKLISRFRGVGQAGLAPPNLR